MKYFLFAVILFEICFVLQSCSSSRTSSGSSETASANKNVLSPPPSRVSKNKILPRSIDTKNVDANELVDFAESLLGTKYKYGSAIKEQGLDCSGLITYVFSKFGIGVPRSSIDFTNAGRPGSLSTSKRGDLILFTGTDTTGWIVGHMGIITANDNGNVKFIHSSSGKNIGVIISTLSKYYSTRFVKVIRLFK